VELKDRIKGLMELKNPPEPTQTVAGEFVPEQIQRMLVALDEMLSSIMISEVIVGKTVPHMELKIKLFLTEFDLLDQQVKTCMDKPKVITSFNFLCLLNLPKLTERFGPLRNFWEGGFKGEGFIQEVKPFLCRGLRQHFERHAMAKCLKTRSMKHLKETGLALESSSASKGEWADFLSLQRRGFHVYGGPKEIHNLLCQRRVLSVVVCTLDAETTHIFSIVRQNQQMNVVPVDKSDSVLDIVHKMGSEYTQWTAGCGVATCQQLCDLSFTPSRCSVSFGVLLPLFHPGSAPKHTLVRSERYGVV
jgi:hypothetical protein